MTLSSLLLTIMIHFDYTFYLYRIHFSRSSHSIFYSVVSNDSGNIHPGNNMCFVHFSNCLFGKGRITTKCNFIQSLSSTFVHTTTIDKIRTWSKCLDGYPWYYGTNPTCYSKKYICNFLCRYIRG